MMKSYSNIRETASGIFLALLSSVVFSGGFKLVLFAILIPILFILLALGIHVNFNADILSTRLSILACILAFGYIAFGDKLMKHKENMPDPNPPEITPDDIATLMKSSLSGSDVEKRSSDKLLFTLLKPTMSINNAQNINKDTSEQPKMQHPQWAVDMLNSLKRSLPDKSARQFPKDHSGWKLVANLNRRMLEQKKSRDIGANKTNPPIHSK